MTTLVLERQFPVPADQVFEFVTRHENILKWFGPEGTTLPEENLDFSRTGPWYGVMVNADGRRFKVSGEVKTVKAPNLVAFTWGWHDESDQRGHESHVTIEVAEDKPGQSLLTLRHEGLADEESRDNHEMGWKSTFVKMERQLT